MSRGGYVPGPSITITARRLPDCPNGHPLYSLNDGPPEHMFTAEEVRNRDYSQYRCAEAMRQAAAL